MRKAAVSTFLFPPATLGEVIRIVEEGFVEKLKEWKRGKKRGKKYWKGMPMHKSKSALGIQVGKEIILKGLYLHRMMRHDFLFSIFAEQCREG